MADKATPANTSTTNSTDIAVNGATGVGRVPPNDPPVVGDAPGASGQGRVPPNRAGKWFQTHGGAVSARNADGTYVPKVNVDDKGNPVGKIPSNEPGPWGKKNPPGTLTPGA
jgi:hypothetical protein